MRAPDRPGLLATLTTALAAAGASVHAATVETNAGVAVDVFELTDPNERKLDQAAKAAVRATIAKGTRPPRRRGRRSGRKRLALGADHPVPDEANPDDRVVFMPRAPKAS